MEDEYRRALSLLRDAAGRPTAKYESYLDHQARYAQKVQVRNDALAKARRNPYELQNWPIAGRRYQEDIEAAETQWSILGFRAEVDKALAVIAERECTTPTEC
jgi:hypothetical protein